MADYKKVKEQLVEKINEHRKSNNLSKLQFDEAISRVSDQHCREMVDDNFTSHWSLNGFKPFQRYSLQANCNDHVVENVLGSDIVGETKYSLDEQEVLKQVMEAHEKFMSEEPPNDVHLKNILDPAQTHVAIGIAINAERFRFVEVFMTRYIKLNEKPLLSTNFEIVGKMIKSGYGPFACTVFFERHPVSMTPEEAAMLDEYPDYTDEKVAVVWPWEIKFDQESSQFIIPISLPRVKAGHYYVQIHIRDKFHSIPYDEPVGGINVPSEDTIIASGFILEHNGPDILEDNKSNEVQPIQEVEEVEEVEEETKHEPEQILEEVQNESIEKPNSSESSRFETKTIPKQTSNQVSENVALARGPNMSSTADQHSSLERKSIESDTRNSGQSNAIGIVDLCVVIDNESVPATMECESQVEIEKHQVKLCYELGSSEHKPLTSIQYVPPNGRVPLGFEPLLSLGDFGIPIDPSKNVVLQGEPERTIAACVVGVPKSGKSSASLALAEEFNLVVIDFSSVERWLNEYDDDDVVNLNSMVEQLIEDGGSLESDPILLARIIKHRVSQSDCQNRGFVIDGYPASVRQWEALESEGVDLTHVMILGLDESAVLVRASKLRLDPESGVLYNLEVDKVEQDFLSRLVEREEDKEEKIRAVLMECQSELPTLFDLLTGNDAIAIQSFDASENLDVLRSTLIEFVSSTRVKDPPKEEVQWVREPLKNLDESKEQQQSSSVVRAAIIGPPRSGATMLTNMVANKNSVIPITLQELEANLFNLREQFSTEDKEDDEDGAYVLRLAEKVDKLKQEGKSLEEDPKLLAKVIKNRLSQSDCQQSGFIIDGFPSTLQQWEAFQLEEIGLSHILMLEMEEDALINRASKLRFDPETGQLYNIQVDRVDENILSRLVEREQDKEDNIKILTSSWKESSESLIQELDALSTTNPVVFVQINGDDTIELVFESLLSALKLRSEMKPLIEPENVQISRKKRLYEPGLFGSRDTHLGSPIGRMLLGTKEEMPIRKDQGFDALPLYQNIFLFFKEAERSNSRYSIQDMGDQYRPGSQLSLVNEQEGKDQESMDEQEEEEEEEDMEFEEQLKIKEELLHLIQLVREEHNVLKKKNNELQRQIIPMMQKREETKEDAAREGDEEKYLSLLKRVHSERLQLQEKQNHYDKMSLQLQTELDEREQDVGATKDSLVQFKREIARDAINSRSGVPIPRRVIDQFEKAEVAKDQEVQRVRLKNISLKMELKKLEMSLKKKEELAEGLHLIDFEQLKIENSTLNEKIEERNEELNKLRKKTNQTVQVLTHIKEKLQFVQAENLILRKELEELDQELNKHRDSLTRAKHERDELRNDITQTKQRTGFSSSDLLLRDYEQREMDMGSAQQRLEELKNRHAFLTSQLQAMQRVQAGSKTKQSKFA